jgi:hypothetical protein
MAEEEEQELSLFEESEEEEYTTPSEGDGAKMPAKRSKLAMTAGASITTTTAIDFLDLRRRLLNISQRSARIVVNVEIIPHLLRTLQSAADLSHSEYARDLAWIVTRIATCKSRHHIKALADNGSIPLLVNLFKSTFAHVEVRMEAAFALAALAEQSETLRDDILDLDVVQTIVEIISHTTKDEIASWTPHAVILLVRNLCEGTPSAPLEQVSSFVLPLAEYISLPGRDNCGILGDALWALAAICDEGEDGLQLVFDSGIMPRVLTIIRTDRFPALVKRPALRIVENPFAVGTMPQIRLILQMGMIPIVGSIIKRRVDSQEVQVEATWVLSNVCINASELIISEPVLLEALIVNLLQLRLPEAPDDMKQDRHMEIVRSAVHALRNLTVRSTVNDIAAMLNRTVLQALCVGLSCREQDTAEISWTGVQQFLLRLEHKSCVQAVVEIDVRGSFQLNTPPPCVFHCALRRIEMHISLPRPQVDQDLKLINILLAMGCDPFLKEKGLTAFDLAKTLKSDDTVPRNRTHIPQALFYDCLFRAMILVMFCSISEIARLRRQYWLPRAVWIKLLPFL